MERRTLRSRTVAAGLATACTLLIAGCGSDGGQPGPPLQAPHWGRTYGGSGDDTASAVQPTADGGYIIAGSTRSFGAGDLDAWLLKLDAEGAVVWQKTYGGAYADVANDVRQTRDGGYIVAGETALPRPENPLACWTHAWLLKLDANGNVVWQRAHGADGCATATAVRPTPGGGYVAAGSIQSSTGLASDAWVVKLDAEGNVLWQKIYGGSDYNHANDIQLTADEGFVVAGDRNLPYETGRDAWILKLDSGGNVAWQRSYGAASDDAAYSVQPTADGGYVVAGDHQSTDLDWRGHSAWVLKLDARGDIVWQRSYGGTRPFNAFGRSIRPTADGGYVVAANFQVCCDHSAATLLKLDAGGKLVWGRSFGHMVHGAGALETTADGGYVVAGSLHVGPIPPHPGFLGQDEVWIARIGATGEGALCVYGGASDIVVADTSVEARVSAGTVSATGVTTTVTSSVPADSVATRQPQCS
jgi:hypothetical protein